MPEDFALLTQGLVYQFGRRRVLSDLNLRVPRGKIYGFLGRNGAGKTTTFRLLMGMLYPDRGTITLGDETVHRVRPAQRAAVGYVSQEQHFYEWMTVHALGRFVGGFYPRWDRVEYRRLLERFSVDARQKVRELSGGTKMKVAVALALAHRPELLLLDEPTAGMDPVGRHELLGLLEEHAGEWGQTVLFSTHQIADVEQIADCVGILHEGRLVFEGEVGSVSQWFRRGRDPFPEPVSSAELEDGRYLGFAAPDVWERLDLKTEGSSLNEVFVAITRDSR